MTEHNYRAFLGVFGKSYTLTLENNGKYFSMPAKTTKSSNIHKITLIALDDLLNNITRAIKTGCTIQFYCDDFDTCYEWNKEYKNKKAFSDTKYEDYWNKIIKQIKAYGIDLYVIKSSYLNVVRKINK